MANLLDTVSKSFNFNLGGFSLPVPYWQAILVAALVFFLIFSMAKFRRHVVDWSFKGAVFGIFVGFLLALLLEGFLILGGRTALTSILGWKNPPKPIAAALDTGRNQLIQVLGINTLIPSSFAKNNSSVQGAVEVLQNLNPADTETVRAIFCK